MSGWYGKVTADPDDLTPLIDCCAHYERELVEAKDDLKVNGRIEVILRKLPGMAEYRYNQLQELEAVLKYLNLKLDQARSKAHRYYMEKYNRQLSSRDAEKYADGDDDVMEISLLINQVALLRNKFLGVSKGIESMQYQLSSIVRLRVAGIEDASLD